MLITAKHAPMSAPPVDGDEDEIEAEDIYLGTFRPPFHIAKAITILCELAVEKSVEKVAIQNSGLSNSDAKNFGVHVNDFIIEPFAIVQACHFFSININALEPCEDLCLV